MEAEERETLAKNVKAIRNKLNLTQEQFAEKIDFPVNFIKKVEQPKSCRDFYYSTLCHFADKLGCRIGDLTQYENQYEPKIDIRGLTKEEFLQLVRKRPEKIAEFLWRAYIALFK